MRALSLGTTMSLVTAREERWGAGLTRQAVRGGAARTAWCHDGTHDLGVHHPRCSRAHLGAQPPGGWRTVTTDDRPTPQAGQEGPRAVVASESLAQESSALLPLVRLWVQLDLARFQFLLAATGSDEDLNWPEFAAQAAAGGLGTWDPRRGVLEVRESDLPADWNLSAEELEWARRLLDYWLSHRTPEMCCDPLRWAFALGDWTAIDAAWLRQLRVSGQDTDPEAIRLLDTLPVGARQENPLLTWAWAAAAGYAAPPGKREATAITRVMADAISLHTRWRDASSVDAAVAAGTIWMLAQRFLPTSPPTASLDASWETQQELAEYIEGQRRRLNSPSPVIEVTFRAASARMALARADLRRVVAEADFAMALDPTLARTLVKGGADLALELMGFSSEPSARPTLTNRLGIGLEFQDEASEQLARGFAALRRLDRESFRAERPGLDAMPPGGPGWTGVVHLHQLEGALWGDPEDALNKTDAEGARHSVVWLEHRHPLGATLLAKGRIALLNRLGAYRAALSVAETLPQVARAVVQAHTLLWSGDLAAASRTAEAGLHDPETSLIDRVMLQIAAAAAVALDDTVPPSEWKPLANAAIDTCLKQDLWTPLALIPPEARRKLLNAAQPADPDILRLLTERVNGLAPDSRRPSGQITLSRREQLLLPLLAGPQTVPEIAAFLHVSPNTVRKQVVALRAKFGTDSRQALVRQARDAGLL